MRLIARALYTLKMAFYHRGYLKYVYSRSVFESVIDINSDEIRRLGVRALVLDFDGVLSPHGYRQPIEEVMKWIDNILSSESPPMLFILSNKPSNERFSFFEEVYPQVEFIINEKKKPYPDGLNGLLKRHSFEQAEVFMVDDRILTGVLAAAIAGVKSIYIKKPYVDYCSKPIHESFFSFLRVIEKVFIL